MRLLPVVLSLLLMVLSTANNLSAEDQLKVLVIDGQNNHGWQATTPIIKWALEQSGRFTVEVSTTPPSLPNKPNLPKNATDQQQATYALDLKKWEENLAAQKTKTADDWKTWHPVFKNYAVVVSNYNGDNWPEDIKKEFVEYVNGGGGFVSVHAADNSFSGWPEYNEMIGVGGWGGRNEKSGPMVRFRDGKIVRDETPGSGGTHGSQHEFLIEVREPEHPIVKGLPLKWRTGTDELYAKLRGPAKNMTVLATAFAGPEQHGTSEHEPILMVVDFGKGRCFHTTLGHGPQAMNSVSFQVTLCRGTEWAATGKVTFPALTETDLPADKAAIREMPKK